MKKLWRPIETFDYETERARVRTIFVPAWVSDGTRVVFAEHWGEQGWMEALNVGYAGPDPLRFCPTHWIGKPDPPT